MCDGLFIYREKLSYILITLGQCQWLALIVWDAPLMCLDRQRYTIYSIKREYRLSWCVVGSWLPYEIHIFHTIRCFYTHLCESPAKRRRTQYTSQRSNCWSCCVIRKNNPFTGWSTLTPLKIVLHNTEPASISRSLDYRLKHIVYPTPQFAHLWYTIINTHAICYWYLTPWVLDSRISTKCDRTRMIWSNSIPTFRTSTFPKSNQRGDPPSNHHHHHISTTTTY